MVIGGEKSGKAVTFPTLLTSFVFADSTQSVGVGGRKRSISEVGNAVVGYHVLVGPHVGKVVGASEGDLVVGAPVGDALGEELNVGLSVGALLG